MMGPNVGGSILLNIFALNPRGYRIDMKSGPGEEERQSGDHWVPGTYLALSASLSRNGLLIILFLTKAHMTKEGRIRPTAVFWFAKKVLKLTLKSFQWGIDGTVCRRLQPSLLLLQLMLPGWPWRHCFLLPLIVLLTLQGSVQAFSDFLPLKINCSHYLLLWLYLVHCVFLCSMNTCVHTCFLLKIKKPLRPGTGSESLCGSLLSHTASWA